MSEFMTTPRRPLSISPAAGKDRGIVLIASLLLLLIVTLLGLSAFRDIGIQERVSSNFRIKTLTFETANSAVQDTWPAMMIALPGEMLTETRQRPLNDDFDLDFDGDGTAEIDLTVNSTICYRGVDVAPGTDTDFAAYLFEMTTSSTEPNGAASQIRQSGYIVAEATEIILPTSC